MSAQLSIHSCWCHRKCHELFYYMYIGLSPSMNYFFKSAYCDFIYLLLVLIHVFDTTIMCCWLLNMMSTSKFWFVRYSIVIHAVLDFAFYNNCSCGCGYVEFRIEHCTIAFYQYRLVEYNYDNYHIEKTAFDQMSISPCVLINFGHCKYRLVFCPTNNISIDFKA